ncbi:flagellar biosynthetic protein FliO [Motiliproteus sp.]|uniref:flagellar biosynthetic protein FliO n=1 Tax=Motiliproteus sp. TaxID=1898955 RepID=UPI003BAB8187
MKRPRFSFFSIGTALLALVPAISLAETAASSAAPSIVGVRTQEFDYAALAQLVVGLVLVLLLFVVLAWLVKRSGVAGGFSHSRMKVISTLPLGARERAVLVQVGDRQLLLGVAPGRVSLLQNFDTPVIEAEQSAPGFANWLNRAVAEQRAGSRQAASQGQEPGTDRVDSPGADRG